MPSLKRSRSLPAARREALAFLIKRKDGLFLRIQVAPGVRPLEWDARKVAAPFPSKRAAETFVRDNLQMAGKVLGVKVVPAG